jgi:hypothetical protein
MEISSTSGVALLLLTTAALVADRPAAQRSGRLAFVIDLDSSGGFHGRGRGGVTIDSDGQVRAGHIGSGKRHASDCRGQLEAGDLQSLQRAVTASGRGPWPRTFATAEDNGCCDRYKWTLRLEQTDRDAGPRTLATTWYDGHEPHLSPDVAVIRDVALRALTRALANCRRK